MWPKYAQKFGHINGKFWARCCSLDMIHMPWHKCPKKYQVFGHNLGTICMFGHILGIFWAHRVGWTYFGHIFDTFGPIVSKMCLYVHCAPAPADQPTSDSFRQTFEGENKEQTHRLISAWQRQVKKLWYNLHQDEGVNYVAICVSSKTCQCLEVAMHLRRSGPLLGDIHCNGVTLINRLS